MNDTVSFETAVRLKEAGFPRPEPHYRQVWYTSDGIDCFTLGRKSPQGRFWADDKILKPDFHTSPDVVFAPTATDILREIRKELDATNKHHWVHLSPLATMWEVTVRPAGGRKAHGFCHEIPAETAALAYEWVKKQKNV